ncbi:MAG: TetR-like C-terminal domain-containing protein [Lachnospiraceae bacterium]|nr:TetR-like C-terminal domain-containing protein [Lachnospiraceae bacterium]
MKALSIFERSDGTLDQVAFEYVEEFLLSGTHSMIQKWIERGKKENVEYMADLLYQMIKNIKQK